MKIKLVLKKFRDFNRKFRLFVGHAFWDTNTPNNKPPNIQDIKNILFIRHDGKIGDYIVTSFAYCALKKANPNLAIDVISNSSISDLFANNPNINQIYIPKKRSLCQFIKLGKQLRKNNYDLVIDTTEVLRNRDVALLRMIQAKNYIGYNQKLKLFNINLPQTNKHITEDYESILKLLGLKEINSDYDIPFNKQSEENINQFLANKSIDNYIVLNFFGAARSRIFNSSMKKILLNKLLEETKEQIVLLTYPQVTKELKELIQTTASDRVFLYENTQSIHDSISLIRHATYVYTPDTSIVHIASGLNKPIVAFYNERNQNNFNKWHPHTKASYKIIPYPEYINDIDVGSLDLSLPQQNLIENGLN